MNVSVLELDCGIVACRDGFSAKSCKSIFIHDWSRNRFTVLIIDYD